MNKRFRRHYAALLARNIRLKLTTPGQTLQEVFYPAYIFLILVLVQKLASDPSTDYPAATYTPSPVYPTSAFESPALLLVSPNDSDTLAFAQSAARRISSTLQVVPDVFPLPADALARVSFPQPVPSILNETTVPFTIAVRSSSGKRPLQTTLGHCRADPETNRRTDCDADELLPPNPLLPLQVAFTSQFIAAMGSADINLTVNAIQAPTAPVFVPPRNPTFDAMAPVYLTIAFYPVVNFLLVNIVSEKESGRKVYLEILGVDTAAFWLAWGTVYLTIVGIAAAVMVLIAAVANLFPTLGDGVLVFFVLGLSTSVMGLSFAISTFFNKARSAGGLGSLILLISSVLVFGIRQASVPVQYIFSLLSPVSVALGVDYILDRRDIGENVTLTTMFQGGGFTIGASILILFADTVLYIFLAWYLDQVVPTEYGVRKKWNFLFKRETYNAKLPVRHPDQTPLVDVEPANNDPALDISNLTKTYTTRRKCFGSADDPVHANDSLQFQASNGEIIGLLGHNGAGKSTLINTLVGLIKPTSGAASVFSMSIGNSMDRIRSVTGFVPQSNDLLHERLTCAEHIRLVAGIKLVPENEVDNLTSALLQEVGIGEAASQRAGTLSGGQKRKLILAMALVGSPSLLILDEHSAGVDIVARRQLWRLLQRDRENRVTLVATHCLEEAEALCDRIVVLDHGRIRCIGTSLQLKFDFDIPYTLSIDAPRIRDPEITSTVQRYVPAAAIADASDKRNVDNEPERLEFAIPLNNADSLPALFEALEGPNGTQLGVERLTISLPSLEDVFLRIEKESRESGPENADPSLRDPRQVDTTATEIAFLETRSSKKNLQFRALLELRLLIRIREIGYWIFAVCLPVVLVVTGLALADSYGSSLSGQSEDSDTVVLNNVWTDLASLLKVDRGDLFHGLAIAPGQPSWIENATSSSKSISIGSSLEELQGYFVNRLEEENTTSTPIIPSAWYFRDGFGSFPGDSEPAGFTVDFVSNFTYLYELSFAYSELATDLLIQASGGEDVAFNMTVGSVSEPSLDFDITGFFAGFLIVLAYSFMGSGPAMPVVRERVLGFDHALRMAGAGRLISWLSALATDLITGYATSLLTFIVIAAFGVVAFSGAAFLPFALGCLLYPISMTLHSYLWSFAFTRVEPAENTLPGIMFMTSVIPFLAVFQVATFVDLETAEIVNYVLLVLLPPYSFASLVVFLLLLDVQRQVGLIDGDLTLKLVFAHESSVYPALIAMIGHAALALFLVRELETSRFTRRARFQQRKWQSELERQGPEAPGDWGDDDVQEERNRVHRLFQNGEQLSDEAHKCHIAACDVTVAYPKRRDRQQQRERGRLKFSVAVDHVSLAITEGQRVALLGPNGAGKSSFMSVLTAETRAVEGSAYVGGYRIDRDPFSAFRTTGYTAQHDRLLDRVTVREHLTLFAMLAGTTRRQGRELAEAIISELGITEHMDKQVRMLSGGTKRKLSLALGTISLPPAQIHDEPSSGLDIYAQQNMWSAVLRRSRNSSAIISTHSMSEAVALCNVIVIMTNGHVRCIGSMEHLRRKYGRGYTVEIVCRNDDDVAAVSRFVGLVFPDARVMDGFGSRVRFKVMESRMHLPKDECNRIIAELPQLTEHAAPVEALATQSHGLTELPRDAPVPSYSTVFGVFAAVKEQLHIEHFSFAQPTVEQISNRFTAEDPTEEDQ